MESLNQVVCESGGCYKWETEIERVEDWHNMKLNVQVNNGSLNALNITAKIGSVVLRGCKEDVDVQFPNFTNDEVKEEAGIKFVMHECNEYLCNSALDIVPGHLIFLPFVLLALNLFTI